MKPARTWKQRLFSLGRWLLLLLLAAGAAGTLARSWLVGRVDDGIRSEVIAKLSEHYDGLVVTLRSARRMEGRGIELRNLALYESPRRPDDQPIVEIDELLATCRTDLASLASEAVELQRLTVRRLRIRATRYRDGSWNLAHLLPLPRFGDSEPPEAVIKEAIVELRDESHPSQQPFTLRDINVRVTPSETVVAAGQLPRRVLRLDGSMTADHITRVRFGGQLDPSEGTWNAGGSLSGLEFSRRLIDSLPQDIAQYLSALEHVRMRAELSFQMAGAENEPTRFQVQGALSEGRIEDARLPYPLHDCHTRLYCDNQVLRLDDFTARAGTASVSLQATVANWLTQPKLQSTGRVEQLTLDARLRDALPASLRDAWDKLSPAGVVNLGFGLGQPDAGVALDLQCLDVAFTYHQFPYRMQRGRGLVQVRDQRLMAQDLIAEAGGQIVRIACDLVDPAGEGPGWLTLQSDGPVALDDRLIDALPVGSQPVIRSLHPGGAIVLEECRVERAVAGGPVKKNVTLQLQDCFLQFDKFPYPITKIRGQLVLADDRWQAVDLRGFNGSAYVVCNGHWHPDPAIDPGIDLHLDFVATDLPLDEQLRLAVGNLNPEAQRFWSGLRPRGTLDHVSIALDYATSQGKVALDITAQKWSPDGNIEGRGITIHPTWFPYRFDQVTGVVRMHDGKITLDELSGKHDASRWKLSGVCDLLPDGGWRLAVNRLVADHLKTDHDLLQALPTSLARGLHRLRADGDFRLDGALTVAGGTLPPTFGWDLLVDIYDGRLGGQLVLEHVQGEVRFRGTSAEGAFQSTVELDVDSLFYKGIQITQLKGPMLIDQQQVLFGSWAERGRLDRAPRQITGNTLGGAVTLDAQWALSDKMPFLLETSLSAADLQQVALETMPRRQEMSGKAFAFLRLQGDTTGIYSLVGNGQIRLRDADVYELPVMVALLSVLTFKPPDTNAFTSSDIDFRVQADHIYLDRIDFHGDAISLKGNGWINFDRNIHLNFYSVVGRGELQLPVVRSLQALASRKILQIEVVGTLNNPDIYRTAFPELDDTLQRIFPETARGNQPPLLDIPSPREMLERGGVFERR